MYLYISLNWPGLESLCYVWGPEVGGIAHLQSQGEGEAANPHRPVPQGFETWASGSEVQYSTPEPPAPIFTSDHMHGMIQTEAWLFIL